MGPACFCGLICSQSVPEAPAHMDPSFLSSTLMQTFLPLHDTSSSPHDFLLALYTRSHSTCPLFLWSPSYLEPFLIIPPTPKVIIVFLLGITSDPCIVFSQYACNLDVSGGQSPLEDLHEIELETCVSLFGPPWQTTTD